MAYPARLAIRIKHRLKHITNPSPQTYQYDPFGNLKQVTDVAGHLTKMFYDLRGRRTSMTDPDMGTWTYQYNVLGEMLAQKDAKPDATMSPLLRCTRRLFD